MKQAHPRGLNRRRAQQLLSKGKDDPSISGRIDILSRLFLGYPYKSNPLIGSAEQAEVFTASLDAFDCVTFIETVLALALASCVGDFSRWLRRMRYDRGRIEWERRNHYVTDWIRNNVREGVIRPIAMPAVPVIDRERVLNVLPGLAARRMRVKCMPKGSLARAAKYLQSGDLMFFASTRRNLDVFHAGIIVRDGARPRMRHASRSQGGVVEQELAEFLKANRMAGVIVMRPQGMGRRAAVGNSGARNPSSLKRRGAKNRGAR
ncbi:MAG TPA: N-acetylmuramoyl-L-alanine amidase-like domain-containing protein [Candidatus Binataceae bacterium]|nr:N-acetylmuramoyl-L-alanine amidase-like domain-containing protein [Candidatus Binataceae bacterium]